MTVCFSLQTGDRDTLTHSGHNRCTVNIITQVMTHAPTETLMLNISNGCIIFVYRWASNSLFGTRLPDVKWSSSHRCVTPTRKKEIWRRQHPIIFLFLHILLHPLALSSPFIAQVFLLQLLYPSLVFFMTHVKSLEPVAGSTHTHTHGGPFYNSSSNLIVISHLRKAAMTIRFQCLWRSRACRITQFTTLETGWSKCDLCGRLIWLSGVLDDGRSLFFWRRNPPQLFFTFSIRVSTMLPVIWW